MFKWDLLGRLTHETNRRVHNAMFNIATFSKNIFWKSSVYLFYNSMRLQQRPVLIILPHLMNMPSASPDEYAACSAWWICHLPRVMNMPPASPDIYAACQASWICRLPRLMYMPPVWPDVYATCLVWCICRLPRMMNMPPASHDEYAASLAWFICRLPHLINKPPATPKHSQAHVIQWSALQSVLLARKFSWPTNGSGVPTFCNRLQYCSFCSLNFVTYWWILLDHKMQPVHKRYLGGVLQDLICATESNK
jgi:hypothetical protein